jgi:hypothetical protein
MQDEIPGKSPIEMAQIYLNESIKNKCDSACPIVCHTRPSTKNYSFHVNIPDVAEPQNTVRVYVASVSYRSMIMCRLVDLLLEQITH